MTSFQKQLVLLGAFIQTATQVKADSSEFLLGSSVAIGEKHTCVLGEESSATFCWGDSKQGEPGRFHEALVHSHVIRSDNEDQVSTISFGGSRVAREIAAGQDFSCAVLSDGNVRCWGENKDGQLGLGMSSEPQGAKIDAKLGSKLKADSITCGLRHACAKFSNKVKCWGRNDAGQLGLGSSAETVGTNAEQMGDNLAFLDLGENVRVKKIRAGGAHTCALLFPGSGLKCWGDNSLGQLGLGLDISPIGTELSHMGESLQFVDLGVDISVIDFALGRWHSCAIVTGLRLKCWGDNYYGQLGLSDIQVPIGLTPSSMGDNLEFVDLGTNVKVVRIALGYGHTCALTNTYQIKCWGDNGYGQLGLGSPRLIVPSSEGEMGDNLAFIELGSDYFVTGLSAGGSETCAILNNSRIKCWGLNNSGQLGPCSTLNIGTEASQMGDKLPFIDDCGSSTWHPMKDTKSRSSVTTSKSNNLRGITASS